MTSRASSDRSARPQREGAGRTLALTDGATAPRQARTFVSEQLTVQGYAAPGAVEQDDVLLATSELVTNAVLHATGPLEVSVDVQWVEEDAAIPVPAASSPAPDSGTRPAAREPVPTDAAPPSSRRTTWSAVVMVTDHGPGMPAPGFSTPDDSSGRGIAIVAAVAQAWGVQKHDGGGKSVWFRCVRHR